MHRPGFATGGNGGFHRREQAVGQLAFTVFEGFNQDADGVWQAPGGGAKICWFSDPDGNGLSLTQFG